jgi:hypothetical protein
MKILTVPDLDVILEIVPEDDRHHWNLVQHSHWGSLYDRVSNPYHVLHGK